MHVTAVHWVVASGLLAMGIAATATSCSGDDSPADTVDGGEGEAGLADRSSGDGAQDAADAKLPPTAMEACRAYVRAFCDRYAECGQTVASCDNYLALCPDYVLATGSARTIDSVLACAQVRRNQPCNEVRANIAPDCAVAGTLAAGAPCHINSQCASYSCIGGGLGACGYCATPAAPDGGCGGDIACGINQTCTGTCQPRTAAPTLEPGDVCPANDGGTGCPLDRPCSSPAPMADAGTCEALPKAGMACRYRVGMFNGLALCDDSTCLDAGAPRNCTGPHALNEACGVSVGADCDVGLFCNDALAGTCKPRRALNELCTSTFSDGGPNDGRCLEDLYCPATGTCQARPKIGEPCPSGAPCATGARCGPVPADGSVTYVCIATPAAIGEACDPPTRPCATDIVCNAQSKCELPPCLPKEAGTD